MPCASTCAAPPCSSPGSAFYSWNARVLHCRSHRWATYVLDCAQSLTHAEIAARFANFCPVSGSPLPEAAQNPPWLYPAQGWGTLSAFSGGGVATQGLLHHCCSPCICDATDFLRVDTKSITDVSGQARTYNFVVILGAEELVGECAEEASTVTHHVNPF